MSVKRYIFDAVLGEYTDEAGDECTALSVVSASAHDAEIAARDAALLREQELHREACQHVCERDLRIAELEGALDTAICRLAAWDEDVADLKAALSPPPSTEGESA